MIYALYALDSLRACELECAYVPSVSALLAHHVRAHASVSGILHPQTLSLFGLLCGPIPFARTLLVLALLDVGAPALLALVLLARSRLHPVVLALGALDLLVPALPASLFLVFSSLAHLPP